MAKPTSEALGSETSGFAVGTSVWLTSWTASIFGSWMNKFLHLGKLLWQSEKKYISHFYYINSRLVSLFNIIDTTGQVPNIFYLTVSLKSFHFNFQICVHFLLNLSVASHLLLFSLSTLICPGSCTNDILVRFLWSEIC
jgi:hypothetical protein